MRKGRNEETFMDLVVLPLRMYDWNERKRGWIGGFASMNFSNLRKVLMGVGKKAKEWKWCELKKNLTLKYAHAEFQFNEI